MTTIPAAAPTERETASERAPRDPNYRDIPLPSGRIASTLIRPTGRHQRDAARVVGKDTSMMTFALVAVTSKLDGQPVTAEELLELDLHDWMVLLGEVLGGKES